MIAKLIVHEDTREAAAARLAEAAGEVEVWPVKANAGFLKRCLDHPRFVAGDVDTGFIAAEEADLQPQPSNEATLAALTLIAEAAAEQVDTQADRFSPWGGHPGLSYGVRLNAAPQTTVHTQIDGVAVSASVAPVETGWRGSEGAMAQVGFDQVQAGDRLFGYQTLDDGFVLFVDGEARLVTRHRAVVGAGAGAASDGSLRAPHAGQDCRDAGQGGRRRRQGAARRGAGSHEDGTRPDRSVRRGGGKRVRLGRGSGRGRLRTGAYQERGVIVVSGALAAMAMTASLMAEPGMQTVRVEPDDLADLQCIVTLMEGIGEDEAQNPSLMPALNYFMGKIAGRGRFERWDKVVVAYRAGLDQTGRDKVVADHDARCLMEGLAPTAAFTQIVTTDLAAAIAASPD